MHTEGANTPKAKRCQEFGREKTPFFDFFSLHSQSDKQGRFARFAQVSKKNTTFSANEAFRQFCPIAGCLRKRYVKLFGK
jgi:hypothetical protein